MHRVMDELVEEMQLDAEVRDISYETGEAAEIASRFGLVPGTAKDVARAAGIRLDKRKINRLIQEPPSSHELTRAADGIAAKWSPELDAELEECEAKARESGILMTPVLLIDGELVHWGHMPLRAELEQWLRSRAGAG